MAGAGAAGAAAAGSAAGVAGIAGCGTAGVADAPRLGAAAAPGAGGVRPGLAGRAGLSSACLMRSPTVRCSHRASAACSRGLSLSTPLLFLSCSVIIASSGPVLPSSDQPGMLTSGGSRSSVGGMEPTPAVCIKRTSPGDTKVKRTFQNLFPLMVCSSGHSVPTLSSSAPKGAPHSRQHSMQIVFMRILDPHGAAAVKAPDPFVRPDQSFSKTLSINAPAP